jgi:hypothetical protein
MLFSDEREKPESLGACGKRGGSDFPADESAFAVRGLRAAFFQVWRELGSEALSTKGWHFPAEVYPLCENTRHIVSPNPTKIYYA